MVSEIMESCDSGFSLGRRVKSGHQDHPSTMSIRGKHAELSRGVIILVSGFLLLFIAHLIGGFR